VSRIRISLGQIVVTATMNQSETARLVLAALPFESTAQRWGREVYFETPITAELENPQAEVAAGTVAYWPPGKALCLFFGQRPYSPVSPVGMIEGDPNVLAEVPEGQTVRVERG